MGEQKWSATILPCRSWGELCDQRALVHQPGGAAGQRGQFRAWGLGWCCWPSRDGFDVPGALYGRADLTQATVAAVISPAFVPYLTEQVAMSGIYVAVAAAAFTVTASFLHLVIALEAAGCGPAWWF